MVYGISSEKGYARKINNGSQTISFSNKILESICVIHAMFLHDQIDEGIYNLGMQ